MISRGFTKATKDLAKESSKKWSPFPKDVDTSELQFKAGIGKRLQTRAQHIQEAIAKASMPARSAVGQVFSRSLSENQKDEYDAMDDKAKENYRLEWGQT